VSAEGTPDGFTPAGEQQCDALQADGVTKGLYGLCVAFCEAHDAASGTVNDEDIVNLPNPDKKLLDIYNRKRAETDPEMPCAVLKNSSCPAFSEQEIQDMIDRKTDEQIASIQYVTNDRHQAIVRGTYTQHNFTDSFRTRVLNSDGTWLQTLSSIWRVQEDYNYNGPGIDSTDYRIWDWSSEEGNIQFNITYASQMTAEEVATCDALIIDNDFNYLITP